MGFMIIGLLFALVWLLEIVHEVGMIVLYYKVVL